MIGNKIDEYNKRIMEERGLEVGSVVMVLKDGIRANHRGPSGIGYLPDPMTDCHGVIYRIAYITNLVWENPIELRTIPGYYYTEFQKEIVQERVWPVFCLHKCSIII